MDPAAIEEMFRIENDHWWFVGKRLLVAALLGDVLGPLPAPAPPRRLLDVGCGTGGVLAHLQARVRAVGVDRSAQALAYCRRRGLRHLACAEGGRLPFAPASFDAVLALDVLEHFDDEAALLASLRALLRPGGWLLVSVPAFAFLWSPHDEVLHHVRRYTAGRLRRVLLDAGFTLERVTYTNVVAFPPALIVRGLLPRIGLRRPVGETDFRVHASWVNRLLTGAYRLEAALLRRVPGLPVGLSVAAVARRPVAGGEAGTAAGVPAA
jgi:SAM-dependent methyltransferase